LINFCKFKEKIFFKFLFTGVLNTIFSYTFFAFLIFLKIDIYASLFISTIIGIIFNYFTFGNLVFKAKQNFSNFIKFIIVYFLSFIINTYLLNLGLEYFDNNAFIVQLISLPFVVLFNWTLINYWVYKNEN